jgi:hypothetical protein
LRQESCGQGVAERRALIVVDDVRTAPRASADEHDLACADVIGAALSSIELDYIPHVVARESADDSAVAAGPNVAVSP